MHRYTWLRNSVQVSPPASHACAGPCPTLQLPAPLSPQGPLLLAHTRTRTCTRKLNYDTFPTAGFQSVC